MGFLPVLSEHPGHPGMGEDVDEFVADDPLEFGDGSVGRHDDAPLEKLEKAPDPLGD